MIVRPKLVIVQNRPTQFDVPLYRTIHSHDEMDLHVYYTEASGPADVPVDDEIGRPPVWDHIHGDVAEYVQGERAALIARRIAAHSPDLVIICGYYPAIHARMALRLRRLGIRIGLRSDNTLRHSQFSGAKGFVKKRVLPSLLRMYDTWHPVGTLAREYLETVSGRRRPSFLFPYNVDNSWFRSRSSVSRERREELRAAIKFGPGDFVIASVAKWTEREDPLTVVDAFVRVADARPDVKLVLVGDGPLRDAVRQRLSRVSERVHLPGYVPYSELPKFYAISDVFVHAAVGEPWGVSVNEAMACGLPVLSAESVGSAADLVIEDRTGFTFRDRDSAALALLVRRLSEDRALVRRLGAGATNRIDEWSYDQTIREFGRAVESVVGQAQTA